MFERDCIPKLLHDYRTHRNKVCLLTSQFLFLYPIQVFDVTFGILGFLQDIWAEKLSTVDFVYTSPSQTIQQQKQTHTYLPTMRLFLSFPVHRLTILHAQRLSKLIYDMTPFSDLLDDVMQLALYDYEKVRVRAQSAFSSLLRHFPAKVKSEKVIKAIQVLESKGKHTPVVPPCRLFNNCAPKILVWSASKAPVNWCVPLCSEFAVRGHLPRNSFSPSAKHTIMIMYPAHHFSVSVCSIGYLHRQ